MSDRFRDVCVEGVALWGHVKAALPRDGAGPSDAPPETKSTKKAEAPPSVNVDVLSAIETVEREAAARLDETSRVLGNRHFRPVSAVLVPALLGRANVYRDQLVERGHPVIAAGLERDVRRWVSLMRRAIGLEKPSRLAGVTCPDDGAAMRVAGEIGRVHPAILNGAASPKTVARLGLTAISWESPEVLFCPECERRYTGEGEWRTLRDRIAKVRASP